MRRQLLQLLAAAPLTRRGDGLRKPVNAPAAGNVYLGVQPGSTAVTRASIVIVSGPNEGIYAFNGTPGLLTIVESSGIPAATTDPFGFGIAVLPGTTTYQHRTIPSSHWIATNVFGSAVTFYTAVTPAGPWTALASMTYNELSSSALSGLYLSGSNGVSLFFPNSPAVPAVQLVGGPVVATDPVLGTVEETWHLITMDAGWSTVAGYAAPQYRLLPDGNIQFAGAASHASFTTSVPLNSGAPLPAVYQPATRHPYRDGNGSNVAEAEYETTGVLNAVGYASGSTRLNMEGIVSLV